MKKAAGSGKSAKASSHGAFSKEDPQAAWVTERGPDRTMRLLADFWFHDLKKEWRTPAGYVVDGASIPRALWTVVGSPYTGDYRRASIVHDKAWRDAAGSTAARKAADRMFYHACRAGQCSPYEATLLYIGVRIGSWMDSVPAWKSAADQDDAGPRLTRLASEERLEADFRLAAEEVLAQGVTDDPRELERRADAALARISGVKLGSRRKGR